MRKHQSLIWLDAVGLDPTEKKYIGSQAIAFDLISSSLSSYHEKAAEVLYLSINYCRRDTGR